MAEKGGKQEKKKTQKASHRMPEGKRASYNLRRSENRLRHVCRSNGSKAARAYADKKGIMPILRRIAGESNRAGVAAQEAVR